MPTVAIASRGGRGSHGRQLLRDHSKLLLKRGEELIGGLVIGGLAQR